MANQKPKQWERDAAFGSDILGVGSFQLIREDIKKAKKEIRINGFVRPKSQPKQNNRRK